MNILTLAFRTIFENISGNQIVDLILTILLLFALCFFVCLFVKRKIVYITTICFSLSLIISYILELQVVTYILGILLLCILFIAFMTNLAEFRSFFANKANAKKKEISLQNIFNKKKDKNEVAKIYDHEAVYDTLNEAVNYLSKNKIGAIITIVRKDDFSNIIKNGTELNCPITAELLETIFYPGTRLHDGAVIIKEDRIIAASVYYTPTTKALDGKFGSRHRAAIGISEVCDAVTIVVSEETGKISIAYNGVLDSYSPTSFLNGLIATMNIIETSDQSIKKDD